MSDLPELGVAIAGGGVGGAALMKVLGFLGNRTVSTLDKSLEELKAAIRDLTLEVRALRDTDIKQAEQIGALQEGQKALTARIDGQGAFWREQIEAVRRAKR